MTNKYIERFLALTEQSILIDSAQMNDDIGSSLDNHMGFKDNKLKRYVFWIGFLLLMVVSLIIVNSTYHKKILVSLNILPKVISSKIVDKDTIKVMSSIPGFRVAAQRQVLHNISLKKLNLALLSGNDYDSAQESKMLLLDKVIVVPKFFG